MKSAYAENLTCFNIVNVEDSPVTRVIDELQNVTDNKPQVLLDSENSDSDELGDNEFRDKNIGLYQKSGHCYSDVKSYIPQIVALTLTALWFSDNSRQPWMKDIDEKKKAQKMRKEII